MEKERARVIAARRPPGCKACNFTLRTRGKVMEGSGVKSEWKGICWGGTGCPCNSEKLPGLGWTATRYFSPGFCCAGD